MEQVAKLFANGRSQAVRLPAQFRFDGDEVFIRQDPNTSDIILSRKPSTWDGFVTALKGANLPDNFLNATQRDQNTPSRRDPFENWSENTQKNAQKPAQE